MGGTRSTSPMCGVPYVHQGGGYPMYIREGGTRCTWRLLAPQTLLGAPQKYPGVTKIAQKGCFFGPNFCLRSKFERFFKKSQIFFRLRADFRKKKCANKGSKRGQNKGFWLFTLFYPILPYFPYFTLLRARSLGAATKFGIKG